LAEFSKKDFLKTKGQKRNSINQYYGYKKPLTTSFLWFIITMKEGETLSNNNYKFKSNFIDFKKMSQGYYKDYFNYFSSNIAETSALSTLAYFVITKGSLENALKFIKENIEDENTFEFVEKFAKDVPEENIHRFAEKLGEKNLEQLLRAIDSDFDRIATPDGVSELVAQLLDLNENDTILDLGSGVGSFLTYVDYHYKVREKYGIELDTSNFITSNLKKLVLRTNVKYILGNMLSQDFKHLKSNKIFSNPPLGIRFSNIYEKGNFEIPGNYIEYSNLNMTGDWAYVLAALPQQSLDGRCVVIVSNSATWNKSDEHIRRTLIEEGKIEGIISLPDNLYPKLSVSLSLVIFSSSNKEIKMVDASKVYTLGRKVNTIETDDVKRIIDAYNKETEISRVVSIEELSSKEYILNPSRYINTSQDIQDYQLLGDLVFSINRGSMISSAELDSLSTTDFTDYHYLMLQNIQDGIISEELPGLKNIDEKYEKFCVEDGDLIISKIAPFKIARVKGVEGKKVLANGNLYFIKIDSSKIDPTYLEFVLQSELGIIQLNRLAKGSTIKNISIQDLKEVRIPIVSLEKQKIIAEKFESICYDLRILEIQTKKLKNKKEKLIKEVI
jgi:type I restriction enzyme M protein